MANKPAILLLASALALPLPAELLKWSLLRKSAAPFTMKSDLFSPGSSSPSAVEPVPATQAEALQKSIAEEIDQSISYEGFILKNARRSALLNVSGEFFVVGEQDLVLDKIKILKISREAVTIEYDGQPYEIRIKGDTNG